MLVTLARTTPEGIELVTVSVSDDAGYEIQNAIAEQHVESFAIEAGTAETVSRAFKAALSQMN